MSTTLSSLMHESSMGRSLAESIPERVLEIRNDLVRDSLSGFEHIEHRLEHVLTSDGVEFINDSKATNVNSTWYALESMDKPVIWIVGGQDKGNDYTQLRDLVSAKVKVIVCLGVDNTKILKAFGDIVPQIIETRRMDEAVRLGYGFSEPGHVVLLSPACASFDLFENYEDRGRQFKLTVQNLNGLQPTDRPNEALAA